MSLILGIESSCDETAAAIVCDGTHIVSSSLATSAELHKKTGGVIPEVAARKQIESIIPVLEDCIKSSGIKLQDLDAIAVTVGPGLIGSLIAGVETAKALALATGIPLIPVNHLVGHIYGNFINRDPSEIKLPAIVLIVSGGHTDLVLMKNHRCFEYLGGTLDDAAGEAFDKVARVLGLASYMGGPAVSKAAALWNPKDSTFRFKRPMSDSHDYNFSFSGIKTAVLHRASKAGILNEYTISRGSVSRGGGECVRPGEALASPANTSPAGPLETRAVLKMPPFETPSVQEIAYEFQEAVTGVLVSKTVKAAKELKVGLVMLAGGVSANTVLREKLKKELDKNNINLLVPPLDLCTDNAAYIASCAHFNFYPKPLFKIFGT